MFNKYARIHTPKYGAFFPQSRHLGIFIHLFQCHFVTDKNIVGIAISELTSKPPEHSFECLQDPVSP